MGKRSQCDLTPKTTLPVFNVVKRDENVTSLSDIERFFFTFSPPLAS